MKATDLLIRQHRELDQLFDQLDRVEEGDRKIVLEQLARCLVAHATIEEETFYPAVKDAARREVERAVVEHGLMDYALAQLLSTPITHDSFEAKAMVLEELIKLHVEREEREILPRAEAAIGAERLAQMGERLAARFEQASETYRRLLVESLAKNAPTLGGRGARAKAAAKKRATPARASKKQAATKRGAAAKRGTATKRGAAAKRASAPQRRGTRSAAAAPQAAPQAKRGAAARKGATSARGHKGGARGSSSPAR